MAVKESLKKLLNSNSNSPVELEQLFLAKYPQETGIHALIREFVYSESPDAITDAELGEILQKFMEGKV